MQSKWNTLCDTNFCVLIQKAYSYCIIINLVGGQYLSFQFSQRGKKVYKSVLTEYAIYEWDTKMKLPTMPRWDKRILIRSHTALYVHNVSQFMTCPQTVSNTPLFPLAKWNHWCLVFLSPLKSEPKVQSDSSCFKLFPNVEII